MRWSRIFGLSTTSYWANGHATTCCGLARQLAGPGHEIYLCEPDPDSPSCITTWNQAEFLSATGLSAAGANGLASDATNAG